MDIYKFINSVDIREHLKRLNYKFSTMEAAWLVWQSEYTTIKEKHEAWKEIIKSMPDCEIKKRRGIDFHPSLHRLLVELIDLQNKQIQLIKQNDEKAVWTYSILYPGDQNECDSRFIATSFEECWNNAINDCRYACEEKDDMTEYLSKCKITIQKSKLNNEDNWCALDFDGLTNVLSIYHYFTDSDYESELTIVLDCLWFKFPTPFKKGDICIEKHQFYCDGPFVLDELCTEPQYAERLKNTGDNTDMLAWGYMQDEDNGYIIDECTHAYMSLEYYTDELDNEKRILKALHNYLNGEIDIGLYSNAYATILVEEFSKKLFPNNITDEGLRLAGLME